MTGESVFISCSSKYTEIAAQIQTDLEGLGIRAYWYPKEEGYVGEWMGPLNKALDEATWVLVLLSPEALDSIWCQRERNYADQADKLILAKIADHQPLPPLQRSLNIYDLEISPGQKATTAADWARVVSAVRLRPVAGPRPRPSISSRDGGGPLHALLIGVDQYRFPLRTPTSDVDLLRETLRSHGFACKVQKNPDRSEMLKELREHFYDLVEGGPNSVGLIYFGGHGWHYGGKSYILPKFADAIIHKESQISENAICLDDEFLNMRTAGNLLNIFVVDCCRQPPPVDSGFQPPVLHRGGASAPALEHELLRHAPAVRNSGVDLVTRLTHFAPPPAPTPNFVLYSTEVEQVALDALPHDRNSPFALALQRVLTSDGVELGDLEPRVNKELMALLPAHVIQRASRVETGHRPTFEFRRRRAQNPESVPKAGAAPPVSDRPSRVPAPSPPYRTADQSGARLHRTLKPTEPVGVAAAGYNGSFVAFGGGSGQVVILDGDSLTEVHRVPCFAGNTVRKLRFASSGAAVFAASLDQLVQIDAVTGRVAIKPHTGNDAIARIDVNSLGANVVATGRRFHIFRAHASQSLAMQVPGAALGCGLAHTQPMAVGVYRAHNGGCEAVLLDVTAGAIQGPPVAVDSRTVGIQVEFSHDNHYVAIAGKDCLALCAVQAHAGLRVLWQKHFQRDLVDIAWSRSNLLLGVFDSGRVRGWHIHEDPSEVDFPMIVLIKPVTIDSAGPDGQVMTFCAELGLQTWQIGG